MSTVNTPSLDVPAQCNDADAIRRRVGERRDIRSRETLVQRVLAEFREMPCLRLTAAQAQRLFGLRSDVSTRVIGDLVSKGQLRLGDDGRYAASEIPPP
jgi:hypothetical protein